jgi:signal transduction histidine kinase
LKARDLKQADRQRQQNERQHRQDERARTQDWRGRAQNQRANLQEERSRKQDERERGQEQREQHQDQRQLAQEERDGQQDERESLRDLFVTVLGHDLRTPLSTIKLAAAGLRRRGTLSGADASAVERIARAAGRMEAMASELLDLARARFAGGFQIQRSRADAVPLMTELLEEFRGLHPDRPVRCELPASAEGSFDRGKVARVISNLLRNAFEYAPAGTPIRIRLVELPDRISFEVSNEGPAIPAAVQETLFDPFRRGRQASRHGLGFGLFIAKEIATAHGGSLSFTSNDGETKFTVTLPRG